jgi:uncharacterized iron-regulated membrane protein
MKLFRKVLFWCHLTVGVIAGLVILIMSATGVLLTYERQIAHWADTRNYHVAPPSPETTRLSVDTLLARARETHPDLAITTVTVRSGATEPVAIGLAGNPGAGPGGGRTVFINPYTGVVISYQWAGNLVYRVVGENPPVRSLQPGQTPGTAGQQRGGTERREAAPQLDNLDALWSRAAQQVSDWRSVSLRMPTAPDAPLTFTIDQGDGGQPHKRAQLTLDRMTGEVLRWEPFSSYATGRKLRSFLRFAHTGEVAGVVGQTLAGLVSLGGGFLVWTGISLALRRLRAWLGRRSGAIVQATDPAPETAAGD